MWFSSLKATFSAQTHINLKKSPHFPKQSPGPPSSSSRHYGKGSSMGVSFLEGSLLSPSLLLLLI
jgi:hypothetical protein